jgi:hypothetical protein
MIKLTNLLKEVDEKNPSSISVKSSTSIEICKKAFFEESPKTKYRIKNSEFEFDFKSFCKNYQDIGISEEEAIKIFFKPIAQTIRIIDNWASTEDVLFLN